MAVGIGSPAPASPNNWTSISITTGSYVLRPLVSRISLSEDDDDRVKITCVELWQSNLYVGTSVGEVLHFVSIPAEASDASQAPSFIFASRLQPTSTHSNESQVKAGVQQILVLPTVGKACLLCNSTLSFYSLPELSPALRNAVVSNCTWVGGTDLNADRDLDGEEVVLMICVQKRVRLVRIGDGIQLVRNIEFPNCLTSVRRNQFACVADSSSYALLDVENQQKITLFPISSLNENAGGGQVEDISFPERSSSLRPISRDQSADRRGHGRQSSLGALVGGLGRRQANPQSRSQEPEDFNMLEPSPGVISPTKALPDNRSVSASANLSRRPSTADKPLPVPPESPALANEPKPAAGRTSASLIPHICSPTSKEFLLTTGTASSEPGVGIFVNLDGDVVRGTLEFARYPSSVVVDGRGIDTEQNSGPDGQESEGYVLAAVRRPIDAEEESVQVQRWDTDDDGNEWLAVPRIDNVEKGEQTTVSNIGIRSVHTNAQVHFPEVGSKLRAQRFTITKESGTTGPLADEAQVESEPWEQKRNKEEFEFGCRLGARSSRIVVWSDNNIWWAVRNPLLLKLEAILEEIMNAAHQTANIDRVHLIATINSIRGKEPTSETEFLSLGYLRQKVSLMLFLDLLARSSKAASIPNTDKQFTESLLMEGGLDPRIILSTIPALRNNIFEGGKRIWIHAGLIATLETQHWTDILNNRGSSTSALDQPEVLGIIKRYLQAWRQRKGFGSVADEVEVFKTVDAALLNVLLHMDRPHPERIPSTRAELYAVVDSGVDCFDEAVALLENYNRLYVLSRLYQQRKMARRVLDTWKRIIENNQDTGGELVDGENEVRKYLVRSRDPNLVDEYGAWLARRYPSLGVQVFTDDHRRVKTAPNETVQLLQQRAPEAVKVYLEHLVFGKKSYQYANDLISYYLDSLLTVLDSSEDARSILSQSYQSYRALKQPKPTYRRFVEENVVPQPWWRDRLRLLELLGGSHGSDFTYDVPSILARLEPFEEDLVPESIILDGRQGRHNQAIKLLVHGLGDYHTAVNYCLLGGASIFYPHIGAVTLAEAQSRDEQVTLFGYLLTEFLRIEDFNDRLERTSELLERFGSYYDIRQVLELIPDNWSVELVSGFLVGAFTRLVAEKSEAMIVKSLSGAENLQVSSAFVEKCIAMGPQIDEIQ